MTAVHIPIDSADVAEQRELEAARAEVEADERRRHAEQCRDGWRGEDADGRPIACLTCRPHLAHTSCRTCSVGWTACSLQRASRRGPCCDCCDHAPAGALRPRTPGATARTPSPRDHQHSERTTRP